MERMDSPDSLEGDGSADAPVGVIKVANESLLSQLVLQSNSPLPIFQSAQEKAYNSRQFQSDMKQELDDMDEFQYINPDMDEELNSEKSNLSSRTVTLVPAAPGKSKSPIHAQTARIQAQLRAEIAANESVTASGEKFVPPLKLTDSLIADDPEPKAERVVRDSLDSSLDEEDFQRLENIMNSKEPLPNPFVTERPTPSTMKQLDISGALIQSATPNQVNSQMSRTQISVMSSYNEVDEEPTPRVQQSKYQSDGITPKAEDSPDRPTSYLQQYKSEQKKERKMYSEHQHNGSARTISNVPEHVGAQVQEVSQYKNTQDLSPDTWNKSNVMTDGRTERKLLSTNVSPKSAVVTPSVQKPPPSSRKNTGTVAPKPPQPPKNFIEKNKDKARGISSAKSSYTSRLMQAKKEQEIMKDWAPGMVIPRKKAASADNAVRTHKDTNNSPKINSSPNSARQALPTDDEQPTAQSVWEQRSAQLSDAKSRNSTRPSKKKSKQMEQVNNMETEDKIDVLPHQSFTSANQGMKLIGPIPQQNLQGFTNLSTRGFSTNPSSIAQAYQPMSGPVQGRNPYVGPMQPHAPAAGPTYSVNAPTGPVYQSHHSHAEAQVQVPPAVMQTPNFPTSPVHQFHHSHAIAQGQTPAGPTYAANAPARPVYRHPSHNQYHAMAQVQGPHSMIPANDIPPHQMELEENSATILTVSNEVVNNSYYQHYQQSQLPQSHQSRWNNQKPPNFVESDIDVTLEEVKVLEENQSYHPPSERRLSANALNPYQAVPPIHTEDEVELKSGGSYSHIHKSQKERKEKEGQNYKTYSISDYKRINKAVHLGGLGPSADPAVLKEKHNIRQRQIQYAKEAREMEAKKASAKPRATVSSDEKEHRAAAPPSGRQLAKEYSKTVPKPKVIPRTADQQTIQNNSPSSASTNSQADNSKQVPATTLSAHETMPHSFSAPTLSNYQAPTSVQRVEMVDLTNQFTYLETIEALHRRHLEEKQAIASIKQKI